MELFDDTFVPPGLRDVWAGSQHCPRCVWPHLQLVPSVDQAHWLCGSCGHCWYLEHGRLRTVDPIMCRGCPTRAKSDCISLLKRDFPRFTAGADDNEVTYT
jgi:hypothetical protein